VSSSGLEFLNLVSRGPAWGRPLASRAVITWIERTYHRRRRQRRLGKL